jgi:hypothetical protein
VAIECGGLWARGVESFYVRSGIIQDLNRAHGCYYLSDLADECAMSYGTLGKISCGTMLIDTARIEDLAQALGYDPEELRGELLGEGCHIPRWRVNLDNPGSSREICGLMFCAQACDEVPPVGCGGCALHRGDYEGCVLPCACRTPMTEERKEAFVAWARARVAYLDDWKAEREGLRGSERAYVAY